MMKRTRCLAALIAAVVPAALSCSGQTGELLLVVQTDMELPKDIQTVRIEITSGGVPWLAQDYEDLGTSRGIKLPATIGITTKNDSSRPVNIRVLAYRGKGDAKQVRVLREATTTVPSDRIATFHMPFSFLCDGLAKQSADVITNDGCAADETCIAGECAPIALGAPPSETYIEEEVFGGGTGNGDGTCFDVTGCMEGGSLVTPVTRDNPDQAEVATTPKVCSIEVDPSAGDMNLAILTETSGMCGEGGCFVALDAGSLSGWRRASDGTTIVLPDAVCRMNGEKVRGIVTAPLKAGCPLKQVRTPTCGPWSSVGSQASPGASTKPVAHASGQHNPSSLALAAKEVLWTSRGLFDATPTQQTRGAVKAASIEPGPLRELSAADTMSARDIVVSGGDAFFTIASASGGGGEVRRVALAGTGATPVLVTSAENPEGLASNGARLFWTEFTSGEIKSVDLEGNSVQLIAPGGSAKHPYRIVADASIVCWTNEGSVHTTAMGAVPDGSVECSLLGGNPAVTEVEGGLNTPRAIALDGDTLYWATFTEGGSVRKATRGSGGFEGAISVAEGLSFPNGLAVDASHIYWTTWGDGGVFRIAKTPGAVPEKIASNQRKPAEIAVGETFIFWVNEGSAIGSAASSGAELVGDGAVLRLLKPN
jgi:sugar lactone lactonase YvrE